MISLRKERCNRHLGVGGGGGGFFFSHFKKFFFFFFFCICSRSLDPTEPRGKGGG